ncbi:sperm equatorial segment protein 1 [Nannospalax galili]|uniref:Sperm equatorial segment protein 1 n=1 Tax=Nannospalax galili TaxID=1026970 RepID=A0A8C6QXW7_NANGA|nr:sperm equatorial segment protein 1 [Nannospalax galili]
MKPVVLVVLWLWPLSLLAYPSITVLPDEEQHLNHYVQVLQNLILSVPTREQTSETKSSSPNDDTPQPRSLKPESMGTPGVTPENNVLRPHSEETTTLATSGFPLGVERKSTQRTPFWSIRPNNVSVVLRSDEPYIEKEEPEPEPEPEQLRTSTEPPSPTTGVTEPWVSTQVTVTTRSTNMDVSPDTEDVPQLSGDSKDENLEELAEHDPHSMRHEEILRKISNIKAQIQQGPLGIGTNPEYKEYIQVSREHLKRSLALAAAAEHKLEQMYRSQVFPDRRTSYHIDDLETVINMLYNSRSKLSEYFSIKHIPPELREKATTVFSKLKRILCTDQIENHNHIRKLLSNNIKLLNLLDVS